MKICLIANPNSPHTHRWIRNFNELGHELYLIGEHHLKRSPPANCKYIDLTSGHDIRKFKYLLWMYQIRRLVRQIQPDILHAHGVASAGWLGAASGFHPFLLTAHGSDLWLLEKRSRLHQLLSLSALKKADYVTCVSHDLAKKAIELGVNKARVEVVYLGVDTRIFYPINNNESLRAKFNFLPGPLGLSIRPISPIYHPLDIASVISLVMERIPSVKFAVFTFNHDPKILSQFIETSNKYQTTEAIIYIDELSDDLTIADYYRTVDFVISVPESDGTPISVLEAMACGKALIVSDLPTIHEWIRDEQEGLIVQVGDVKAIAEAIIRILSDSELCSRLGKNAAKVIQERGDARFWTIRSLAVYQKLIQASDHGIN